MRKSGKDIAFYENKNPNKFGYLPNILYLCKQDSKSIVTYEEILYLSAGSSRHHHRRADVPGHGRQGVGRRKSGGGRLPQRGHSADAHHADTEVFETLHGRVSRTQDCDPRRRVALERDAATATVQHQATPGRS